MDTNTVDGIIHKFVQKTQTCWLWIGCLNDAGYGVVHYRGRTRLAHRLLYSELKGAIPEDRELDHLCRVRHCVNPDHLECVTRAINVSRGDGRRHTHCSRGHLYTEESRYIKRDGSSICKICRREHMQRLYAHRREGGHHGLVKQN